MMNFNDAFRELLTIEMGYVDHPLDKGGKTKYGITQKTYEAYIGRKLSDAEAESVMKNLSIDTALKIYKKEYWDKIGGDKLKNFTIAAALFDQAVNRGVIPVLKQAQAIVGTTADGIIGPKTIAALNAVNESAFLSSFLTASKQSYATIVKNNPSQAAFYDGWMKRVDKLTNYVTANLGKLNGAKVITGVTTVVLLASLAYFSYKYYQNNNLANSIGLGGTVKA